VDMKEANRLGWPDDRVLAWAIAQHRIVVTHDKDFAALLKSPMARRHAGVILLRLRDQRPPCAIATLLPVLVQIRSRRMRNALVIIGEESIEYIRG
jgi:predicted nuclease of predicted toxin-antitoxin system